MNEFTLSIHLQEAQMAFNILMDYIENTVYGPRQFCKETAESLIMPIRDNIEKINKLMNEEIK